MGNFKDDRQVYAVLGRLFQDVLADPALAPQVQRLDGVVQFQHRNPNATITIKAVKGEDPVVDLGATELRADVIVVMDADTAHAFWLGRVNATMALNKGQIKAKGPVDKVLRLVALVKPIHKRYAQLLVELGAAAPEDVGAEAPAEAEAEAAEPDTPVAESDAAEAIEAEPEAEPEATEPEPEPEPEAAEPEAAAAAEPPAAG
jgi:ubiquinone biosynthesis protein UbiJ